MILAPFLLISLAAQVPPVPHPPHPERVAAEKPIRAYFRYHQTGDPKGLAEAFHPDALLQWAKEGQRMTLSQSDWQQRAGEQLTKAEGKERPAVTCAITWMEITGDAAVARVDLDYPTFRFIDYLHLIKLREGWKIVDKIYHREEGKH